MKRQWKTHSRRALALALTAILTAGLSGPSLAAGAALPATHDETYYATLDYYGGILDSSVVKSYQTFGNDTITDYGVYDQVVNLTDDLEPAVGEDSVTFRLGENAPNRFYFEGKTTKPLDEFPWTLSLSYTLNGVPTLAQDLAGKSGLVEITLDAVPNPAACEYSRNNLVLTAMSMFNGDDILSLEAQGAQVQLVGNLYCVLFMVMPGEEQHFSIRVGSEDFSYDGMIFLAVPATLEQLSQVADLREAKEKVEDSYHALNDSLDVILDSLQGMSGSLNATANGLDQLNRARDTISSGKGQVYDSLDAALDAAGPLVDSMKPMAGHLETAQQALTDTTALLNQMNDNIVGLRPEVENTRKIIKDLQSNLSKLRELLDDLEDYPAEARRIARDLSDDFTLLGDGIDALNKDLTNINSQVTGLQNQLDSLPDSSQKYVPVNGQNPNDVYRQVRQGQALYGDYQTYRLSFDTEIDFGTYLVMEKGHSPQEAQAVGALLQMAQNEEFQTGLKQAILITQVLEKTNLSLTELKTVADKVVPPAKQVSGHLGDVCKALGGSNLSGELRRLSNMMKDLMDDVDENGGSLSSVLHRMDDIGDLITRVSGNAETALDQLQALTDIMNTYEPEARQALSDAQIFTDAASAGVSALVDAARDTEALAKRSGTELDAGTQQALSGLAAALRKSTVGLSQTGTIREAKDTVDALITGEWDSHTGEDNNLLLMDAGAKPVSLTDQRNEGTASIQYVMRSQEIKAEEPEVQETAAVKTDNGTIWTRIADMFRDIWNTITGIFKG